MIKQLFCGHDYNIITQVVQKSELETLIDKMNITKINGSGRAACILTIYKCSKCNKVRESLWVME